MLDGGVNIGQGVAILQQQHVGAEDDRPLLAQRVANFERQCIQLVQGDVVRLLECRPLGSGRAGCRVGSRGSAPAQRIVGAGDDHSRAERDSRRGREAGQVRPSLALNCGRNGSADQDRRLLDALAHIVRHLLDQRVDRAFSVAPGGVDADAVVFLDPQREELVEAIGMCGAGAGRHVGDAHFGVKGCCGLDKAGRRAKVQAGRIDHDDVGAGDLPLFVLCFARRPGVHRRIVAVVIVQHGLFRPATPLRPRGLQPPGSCRWKPARPQPWRPRQKAQRSSEPWLPAPAPTDRGPPAR